jgi:hypothetical protein
VSSCPKVRPFRPPTCPKRLPDLIKVLELISTKGHTSDGCRCGLELQLSPLVEPV